MKKSLIKLKVSWLSCQKVTSSFNNRHSNLSFHHRVHAHNLKNVNCIVFLSLLPHTKTQWPQTTPVKTSLNSSTTTKVLCVYWRIKTIFWYLGWPKRSTKCYDFVKGSQFSHSKLTKNCSTGHCNWGQLSQFFDFLLWRAKYPILRW